MQRLHSINNWRETINVFECALDSLFRRKTLMTAACLCCDTWRCAMSASIHTWTILLKSELFPPYAYRLRSNLLCIGVVVSKRCVFDVHYLPLMYIHLESNHHLRTPLWSLWPVVVFQDDWTAAEISSDVQVHNLFWMCVSLILLCVVLRVQSKILTNSVKRRWNTSLFSFISTSEKNYSALFGNIFCVHFYYQHKHSSFLTRLWLQETRYRKLELNKFSERNVIGYGRCWR